VHHSDNGVQYNKVKMMVQWLMLYWVYSRTQVHERLKGGVLLLYVVHQRDPLVLQDTLHGKSAQINRTTSNRMSLTTKEGDGQPNLNSSQQKDGQLCVEE
jgi:hypothetical protein